MNFNYALKEVNRTFSIAEVLKNNMFVDALKALDVKGNVKVFRNDSFSVRVYVNGNYFGIWDNVKYIFVD